MHRRGRPMGRLR